MCDKHHTVYLYGTCAFQKGRLGNASFPLISLSSIIAESGIEFTILLRQSIRALHADVDVVRSTGGGGSRSETVLLVHVNGTYQLSEGNGQSDAAFGKDRKKNDVEGSGKIYLFEKGTFYTIERYSAHHTEITSSRLNEAFM